MDLTNYLKAGYPLIHIVTQEADRATRSVKAEGWKTYSWDCLRGITEPETGRTLEDIADPLQALKWLAGKGDTILISQNFHHFITSVEIIQEIQNSLPIWKGQGSCLVIPGPRINLPLEIEKYFTLLDFNLPSPQDLLAIQEELGKSVGVYVNGEAVEAARGLTEFEAETAFALSLVVKKQFCPDIITEQKKQMIRRSGLMEFWPPVPIDQLTWKKLGEMQLIFLKKHLQEKEDFEQLWAEARTPVRGGLRFILDNLTEEYKRSKQEKYVNYVLKTAMEPLEQKGKANLMGALMKRLDIHLEPEIRAAPGYFAPHYELIIKVYIQSMERIKSLLRSL